MSKNKISSNNNIPDLRVDVDMRSQLVEKGVMDSDNQKNNFVVENDTERTITEPETGTGTESGIGMGRGIAVNMILLNSLNSTWRNYRLSSYLSLLESLLSRGGCEFSMQHAMALLRVMVTREGLLLHQSQIRSLIHYAILHDLGPVPITTSSGYKEDSLIQVKNIEKKNVPNHIQPSSPSPLSTSTSYPSLNEGSRSEMKLMSTYGNGIRLFLTLREIVPIKPDEVLYKMVLKSLIKRRKKIQLKVARPNKQTQSQSQSQLRLDADRSKLPIHPTLQDFDGSRVQVPDESDLNSDSDLSSLNVLLQCMIEDGVKASTHIHREVRTGFLLLLSSSNLSFIVLYSFIPFLMTFKSTWFDLILTSSYHYFFRYFSIDFLLMTVTL